MIPPRRIVILGGGTAGWITANLLVKAWGGDRDGPPVAIHLAEPSARHGRIIQAGSSQARIIHHRDQASDEDMLQHEMTELPPLDRRHVTSKRRLVAK